MNVLGLVFSLLLILSYGFYACWDKHVASSQLRTTYVGHQKANRKLLNRYQSAVYSKLRGKATHSEDEKTSHSSTETSAPVKLEINRECAKLNLRPLIQEGKGSHPLLYELTAKLIRTFYAPLCDEKRFEYLFLDDFLAAAKSALQEDNSSPLEKLDLKEWRTLYYKMLKGTKEWDLHERVGHPALLDYVKIENQGQHICLFHAHPDLLTVLFNDKTATKLHQEIHKEGAPLLTQELIERICSETHYLACEPAMFPLLELGKPDHQEYKKTLLAKDHSTQVTLRKSVYLKN